MPPILWPAPHGVNSAPQQQRIALARMFLKNPPIIFLDEPTASWVTETLGVPVVDNYWQTESGWPIMALARASAAVPSWRTLGCAFFHSVIHSC